MDNFKTRVEEILKQLENEMHSQHDIPKPYPEEENLLFSMALDAICTLHEEDIKKQEFEVSKAIDTRWLPKIEQAKAEEREKAVLKGERRRIIAQIGAKVRAEAQKEMIEKIKSLAEERTSEDDKVVILELINELSD